MNGYDCIVLVTLIITIGVVRVTKIILDDIFLEDD